MEKELVNAKGQLIKIIKEPTDPLCMRVSIGGWKTKGYYLVFRGDNLDEIEEMLKETYQAFILAKEKF